MYVHNPCASIAVAPHAARHYQRRGFSNHEYVTLDSLSSHNCKGARLFADIY